MHANISQLFMPLCVCHMLSNRANNKIRNETNEKSYTDTDKSCEAHLQESSRDRKQKPNWNGDCRLGYLGIGDWVMGNGDWGVRYWNMLQNAVRGLSVCLSACQLRCGLKMSATLAVWLVCHRLALRQTSKLEVAQKREERKTNATACCKTPRPFK